MLNFSLPVFLHGLTISGSLIIAIGAQNAFVLRRGLKQKHVFAVTTTCFICDILLISLGVFGFAPLISSFGKLHTIITLFGACFLFVYGALSFRSMFKKEALNTDDPVSDPRYQKTDTLKGSILLTLAFTLLNPHAILDTVVLIGTIGSQYDMGNRVIFTFGAFIASCLWFYSLGYGARFLAPVFKSPKAWKILDCIIGIIMWGLALMLAWPLI